MSGVSNGNLNPVVKKSSIEDLYSSAQKQILWSAEVLQEIMKLQLEVGYIPVQFPLNLPSENLKSYDNNESGITIIFTDYNNPEDMNVAIQMYEKIFQSKTVIIQIKKTWFNKCALNAETVDRPISMDDDLLVLFISKMFQSENVKIRTSFCYNEDFENKSIPELMWNELMPENDDFKTIVLLFGINDEIDDLVKEVLKVAKKRLKPKMYNVWGGTCEEIVKERNAVDKIPICYGLTISGSNFETWSYINTDCFIKRAEFRQNLLTFKNDVKLRNHSLGLVIGPAALMNESRFLGFDIIDESLNSVDCMETIKEIFPMVPFMGIFNNDCDRIYTSSPTSDPCSDIFVCGKIISLLIITYD